MNAIALLTAVVLLAFAVVGALMWAMAERARAARFEAKAAELERQAGTGAELLKAQAAQSANTVAQELVRRAAETFKAQDAVAQAKLEAQLKPVADTLARFEARAAAAETVRAADSGGLKVQIEQLLAASVATQAEARKLSAALRRGAGVQGRWGEQMLRNVLELAGMRAGVDFVEQLHIAGEGGASRPDVVVRLPGGGSFVIDAKCSLNAFLEGQDAVDEAARELCYARHAVSVRAHMKGLSDKAYWEKLESSPDFVAMFIPGDAFLSVAAERAPDLFTQAMERRVLLVTPSSLYAVCKAVSYGWRVERQARNAAEIAALGRELYKRLATMGGHVQALGTSLGRAVGAYNQFTGSLETMVLSQARRFEDLEVEHEGKAIDEAAPIEAAVRPLTRLGPALTLVEAAPTSTP